MQEEINATNGGSVQTLPAYKKTALLVSSYVMIAFVLRYIAMVVISLADKSMAGTVDATTAYIIELFLSVLFLHISPSVIGAFMFGYLGRNGRGLRCLYTVPKSNSRAIGNFTAVYGFTQIFNVLTIIVMYFLTNQADLTRQLNTVADQSSYGYAATLVFAFLLVVIAPVFEEFMFRGLILHALKPYGNGLSIFVSGLLFGIYHGNFQQCFYTAALGIALGYIANVTGSILPTTILHALSNSLGAIIILLINTDSVQEYIINGNPDAIPDSDMIWVALYGIFMVSIIILIIVGLISAVMKLRQIKRYKVPKVWGEVTNGKKVGILLCTIPAILTIIMIIDTYGGFSNMLLASLIYGNAG